MQRPAIPRATYRVQLHAGFTFRDAAAIVPYLATLGISHLYVSPILKARPGSLHGYDVIDYTQLNPELGTRADFDALVHCLHQHDMRLLVDIVPNHMGVMADDNAWWLDVLENGSGAEHAHYFDIDWHPPRASMQNRLLVPVLGAPFGLVLERGELQVRYSSLDASFSVHYHEHRFPIDPREYPRLFAGREAQLATAFGDDEESRQDFESLLSAFGHLPSRDDCSHEARIERYRDKEAHKRRLQRLCERTPALMAFIEDSLHAINGTPDDAASFDSLAALLDAQAYRLAYWRVAGDEINYRRFFDINQLAALRMNDPEVFAATHGLIVELVHSGHIDGLRIDHPDGLYDPAEYFQRLQQTFQDSGGEETRPIYLVAEKILAAHERLPEQWLVHGTTGYDFGSDVGAWFVDPNAERPLRRSYEHFAGMQRNLDDLLAECKRVVMESALAAEIAVLTTQLDRIAQLDRRTADFTRFVLRDAITDTIACFPVYRTYVSAHNIGDDDRRHVSWAINIARKHSQAADVSAFDFLQDALLCDLCTQRPTDQHDAIREFALKFQQVTAPVMAKGVEDTAFYICNKLTALNEVGGDPRRFGFSTSALHIVNGERLKRWPHTLLATSTHDSKRSEDVRMRLTVLSEIPADWRHHVVRWNRINRSKRSTVDGRPAPNRNDEYLIYQTLLGICPHDMTEPTAELVERVVAYAIKAAREAKVSTSWVNVNDEYEAALTAFIERLLSSSTHNAFLHDFAALLATVAYFGMYNSISQAILKLTAPGVPDIYQGGELPMLRLVDPDNRVAVDYAAHATLLSDVQRAIASEDERTRLLSDMLANPHDGRLKLFATWQALQLRKRHAALFSQGHYEPLRIEGPAADHLIAFARTLDERAVLVVVPRWFARITRGELRPPLGECWRDTYVEWPDSFAGCRLRNVLTHQHIAIEFRESELPFAHSLDARELMTALPVVLAATE